MMKNKNDRAIQEKAVELLRASDAFAAPVRVQNVARFLGLRVEAAALGDGVAGVLVVEKDRGAIGYNDAHPAVRQRFSIAHEIGHFVLHRARASLFIDKHYVAVYRRDRESSKGEDIQEIQANRFAAALLMPKELIMNEIEALEFDLGDEKALEALSSKFQVSVQAMSIRLASLGIFSAQRG